MSSFGKLKIGSHYDDTPHESRTTLAQHALNGKGKEKIVSTSIDKSLDGKAMLDSTDTETTRTPRGRTHMDMLSRRRVQGIRKEVRFNKLGQPVGEAAVEMQSYVGLLAREKVKISYKTWKQVPSGVKDLIWESVNLNYDVPPTWKKGCLNSANNKWRQFKSYLTQTFVSNKIDKPDELDNPPTGYGLERDDWISFVMSRMSDEFIKQSDQQKEKRKKNIYPHRLSRKGYARYAEEIADELCDDDEINRAIIWKKGRVNKEGVFDGHDLQTTVDKIDDYILQKREVTLEMKGPKTDILTKALNSEEHGGRVRAVGGHITPTIYFNASRRWNNDIVDRELMIEQKRELMEARKLIQEQDTRIQKLEAIVYKKGAWDSDIDDKGSCSVKLHQVNSNEELNDAELQILDEYVALQGEPVILTLDYSTEIAAYGTAIKVDGPNVLLHGVPLPPNCMRVSIDEAMQKSARLPVPIPNECEIVGDAVGTHVAWPKHLIMLRQEKKQMKKKVCVEKEQIFSSSVPRSLRMLYCYCKSVFENGRKLSFLVDHEVFEDHYELNLHLEDIIPLLSLDSISENCVVVYIWHLYKKMTTENKADKIRFVNPHKIPDLQKIGQDKTGKIERLNQRASSLANRLSGAAVNQFVLVPSCSGFHWNLTVIEPYKDTVYFLDSVSQRIRDEDWKYVVEMALRLFNSNKGRKGRKNVQWEIIKVPRQPDAKQCGYYVMSFMRQIVEDIVNIEKESLRSIFTKQEYSREEIDVVRSELAECIQDQIYE